MVSVPDSEVKKLVERDAIGNRRQYPMVISFSEGDPLDEEVRDAVPRPPLPEINESRGRIGFDMSTIQQLGQAPMTSSEYGMVVRADISRMFGTHWNLNGYWRGSLQSSSSSSAQTLQDSMNRTYLMSLTYINPNSPWNIGVGRLYLPWASSLETIDGGYVAHKLSAKTLLGAFGGSTPDPAAWDYNPQRKIFGGFFNAHGGSFERFHYSTTAGAGVNLLDWKSTVPFCLRRMSFRSNGTSPCFIPCRSTVPRPIPARLRSAGRPGQNLFTLRVQPYRRISLDLTDNYRDVPTYSSILVGTGLLDKYLYQGINGGARVDFPLRLVGYFSLGDSNTSNDKKDSLNEDGGSVDYPHLEDRRPGRRPLLEVR